jgi:polysaccharide biosynthesis transport protein
MPDSLKNSSASAPAPPPLGVSSSRAGMYAPQRNVHLFDRLAVVVKYYKVVIVVSVLVIAGMMYQAYTTVPRYAAHVRIQIDEESMANQGDLREPYITYQDPEPFYNTQYKILSGRELARRVVRRIKLQDVPEFNGRGATPTRLSLVIQSAKARILQPFGGAPSTPPVVAPGRGTVDEESLISAFLGRVQVAPVKGSRLVDVSFISADREFAAKAANLIGEEYVAQNLETRLEGTEKSLQWMRQEVQRQMAIVKASETTLAQYREQQNALSLEDRQNIVVSRLNQLNDAVTRARTTRVAREASWNQVKNTKDPEALSTVVTNPLIQSLRSQVATLERDRAKLTERYAEKHPEVIRISGQLAETRRLLDQEVAKQTEAIRNDYEAAVAEEQQLKADLDAQNAAVMDLNRKGIDYSVLQRENESTRQVYESLLQRQKELEVVSNSRANNVRVIDRAQIPGGPFEPNLNRAWMMALLFGLGLGVAAAFAVDYLDDTVKTPEDVTWRLKLHFLGLVPKVRGERHPLLSGPVPHDFGEAFRALRTALVMSNPSRSTRIVAVTSAQPLEGKTTTAVNIALALAIGGSRVLLIDADMRRPSLHKALSMPNEKGLSHLLTGQAKMREVVHHSPDPNLLVITAGAAPPNPSELLAGDTMRAFIQQLAVGPFDWVIMDTPPVLAVTDAVILAPLVSGVTFVLGAEMTRWRLAERAIETIQAGNPQSISAVLNKVDFDRNRYYYARYYGHQYHSYYAETPAAS